MADKLVFERQDRRPKDSRQSGTRPPDCLGDFRSLVDIPAHFGDRIAALVVKSSVFVKGHSEGSFRAGSTSSNSLIRSREQEIHQRFLKHGTLSEQISSRLRSCMRKLISDAPRPNQACTSLPSLGLRSLHAIAPSPFVHCLSSSMRSPNHTCSSWPHNPESLRRRY